MIKLFGIGTNQGDALNRARRELSEAQQGLKEAQAELNRTDRAHNGAAAQAVYSWRNRVHAAEAKVSQAEANMH